MHKVLIFLLFTAQSFAICQNLEKFISQGVPEKPLKQALYYYKQNSNLFENQKYISIIDYSQSSKNKRYYLLNLETGNVSKFKVSHGSGKIGGVSYGDPEHDGVLNKCKHSNKVMSSNYHNRWAMTRPGFFVTLYEALSWAHDPTNPKAGKGWPMFSLKPRLNKLLLDGLSEGINDKALEHGVVMHEAYYNKYEIMGRSFGCPAFKPSIGRKISTLIKEGSLVYSYVPQCADDHKEILENLGHWQQVCY